MQIQSIEQALALILDDAAPEVLVVILRRRGTLHLVKDWLSREEAFSATQSALEEGFEVEVEEQD